MQPLGRPKFSLVSCEREDFMSKANYKTKTQQWVLAFVLLAMAHNGSTQTTPVDRITDRSPAAVDTLLVELEGDEDSIVPVELDSDMEALAVLQSTTTRIEANTTLYIGFTPLEENGSPLIPEKKIYTIDRNGFLSIDNVGQYKLAGLTESEAALRLSAEDVFADYDIYVTLLPVEPEGLLALEPFGHDLFESDGRLTGTSSLPVPAYYTIGPGDSFVLQLFGSQNEMADLTVSREGFLDIPHIGPVQVAGQTFAEVRKNLSKLVEQQLIGTSVSVTLGELRSINVLVVGEAKAPGSYQVSAMSNVIDLLNLSGGISDIGSYRNITIKRAGKTLSTLDLYDLLLKGNVTADMSLESGDVVFIPPMKNRVYIEGEVKRPAIYELNGSTDLTRVLSLAGGLTDMAYSQRISIQRTENNQRSVVEADLGSPEGRAMAIKAGDHIRVQAVEVASDQFIKIHGEVFHDGNLSWRVGQRVSDVLGSVEYLKRNADIHYALVKRFDARTRQYSTLSFSPQAALDAPGSEQDMLLQPSDEVFILGFGAQGQRQNLLNPLVEKLKQQANHRTPAKVVSIEGGVFEPGTYPLTEGMRISELVKAAGDLKESASSYSAELTRVMQAGNGERYIDHIRISLSDILAGKLNQDTLLKSYDSLTIKSDPRWSQRYTIEITGEVRYPGVYPIARGEQLSSVIERAGGLTDLAFEEGTFFSRESVREAEAEEVRLLADRLEVGMKATILERADEQLRPRESLDVATDVIQLLRSVEAPGRIVIDMPTLMEESRKGKVSDADVTLMSNDTIHIPQFKEVITVVGQVNRPSTHLFSDNLKLADYLDRSGGITPKSKKGLVYVVKADGSAMKRKAWWRGTAIEPGDTIVVPLNVEKIRKLKAWNEATSVLGNVVNPAANVVTAAAAWKTAEAIESRNQQVEDVLEPQP